MSKLIFLSFLLSLFSFNAFSSENHYNEWQSKQCRSGFVSSPFFISSSQFKKCLLISSIEDGYRPLGKDHCLEGFFSTVRELDGATICMSDRIYENKSYRPKRYADCIQGFVESKRELDHRRICLNIEYLENHYILLNMNDSCLDGFVKRNYNNNFNGKTTTFCQR